MRWYGNALRIVNKRGCYPLCVDLAPALEPGVAIVEDGPLDLDAILERLAVKAAAHLGVSAKLLHHALQVRERVRPTAVGGGVALPHAILPGIPRTLVIPALVRRGVLVDPASPPSTILLGLFGDQAKPWDHVKMLARLARIVHDQRSLEHLRLAIDPDDLVRRVMSEDAAHA